MKRTKAVALIMMLVLFMVMMPQALWISAAEELREIDITIPAVSTEVSTAEEEPYILYEDENKRTENEKHFVMSDGTMMMEQYQEAIHYRDIDGKFREIDNTFEEKVEDGIAYYGNRANKFEALFNRTMQDGDLMKMRQGQYELSFDFLGREYQTGFEELFEQASEVIARVDRDYLNQTKSKIDYRAKKLTKAAEPSNLSSLLRYQNMIPGVDIEYKVLPNGVKENIILSKRLSSYDFRFALKTENLILELMPTGEIYAWPSDTDEVGLQPVYVIPAPYMADQAGAVSTDIRYELIEQAGGYLLKLIADEDWLNAAERSYPVVLDPIIETPVTTVGTPVYATVYEKGKATETSVSEYVVAGIDNDDSTKGLFSSYIRLNFSNNIADNYQIISGTFTYHRGNASIWWGGMGYDVVVSQPVGDMTKLTWSNKPRTLEKIEDGHIGFLGGDTSNTLEFNTNFIFNNSITFGFIFDDTNLARNWVKIYVHNSSKPLSLSLKYKYRTGLNENAKYEKISLDGATVYVDTFNRKLTTSFDILGTNSGIFPLQLTGVYNTAYDSLMEEYGFAQSFGKLGKNIKLNFDQYLTLNTNQIERRIYIDQDGSINTLDETNNYFENGLKLAEGVSDFEIVDVHGNTMGFNKERPSKIFDTFGNELSFFYRASTPSLLVKVSNNKGHININYNSNNYISSVVNNYGESRTFEYDTNNNLIAIKNVTNKIFEFGYDSNGYLNQVIDKYRQGIQIQYTAGSVNTIYMTNGDKSDSVTSNDQIMFSKYAASSIVKRYDHGRLTSTTEYGYDNSGRCLSEITYEGAHTATSSAAQVNAYVKWNVDGPTIGNNSNHSFTYTYEEDLSSIPNGTFDTDSNWLRVGATISGGRAKLGKGNYISQSINYTANQRGVYVLSFLAEAYTKIATLKVTVNSSRSSKTFSYNVPNYNKGYLCFDIGELFEGTDTYYIRIENQAQPAGDVYIDNVSICMLSGYSDFQPGQYNSQVNGITYTSWSIQGTTKSIYTYNEKQDPIKLVKTDFSNTSYKEETTYTYNDKYQVTSEVAKQYFGSVLDRTTTTSYTYNSSYFLTQKTVTVGSKKQITQYSYNGMGMLDSLTDSDGNETLYRYGTALNGVSLGDYYLLEEETNGIVTSYEYMDGRVSAIRQGDRSLNISYLGHWRFINNDGNIFDIVKSENERDPQAISLNFQNLITYHYSNDAYKDLSRKEFANGQSLYYTYQATTGNLMSVSTDGTNANYTYTYDGKNRVTDARVMDGESELLKYHYSDLDSKKTDQLTMSGALNATVTNNYSGGVFESTQFKWNNLNAYSLTTTFEHVLADREYNSDSSEHESSVKYDEFGRLNNYTLKRGNGSSAFSKSYQYETTNGSQTNRISTVTDGSDTYQYSYSNGNLTTVKKNGTIQSSYLSGTNGRIIYESQPLMGINQQYEYDKDNITRVYSNSALKTYETYGYTDNLLTSHTKENITRYFAYDGMGNPVRYKTASQTSEANMVWTEGRVLKSGIQNGKVFSYEYDALGKRYQKTVDGKVTKQYWSGNDLVAEERINGTSTTVLIFLYDWTGVCGMKRLSEKSDGSVQTDTYWFKKNELGDIAEIYGVNGKLCEYRYDAWGNYRLIDSGTGMDVTKDQVIGGISTNVSAHIGHINPFRYRGYYYDEETGFYYLNTRYYDPEIRRFINADNPELVAQLAQTPGQLNLYAYCNNNPVAFTDESGESVWAIIVVGLIVTVISGISGGYSAAACNQNFWIGFAAGAAAGLVGYALGLLKMPYLGRMVSSAGYTLLNSWWQNGEITQDDWLFIAGDLFMDIPLSFLGKYYIGSLKESMQNIILTALDGATDYIQTRGLVELLPERYLKADSSQTQTTRNFSMQNSDAQKFYIVGI